MGIGLISQFAGHLSRAWRVVATGLSFALSGLVLGLMAMLVLPLIRLRGGKKEERELRAQYAAHVACRLGVSVFVALGAIRLQVRGGERLRQPGQLFVANHPTLIDAVVLISLMPMTDCVVKASHSDNLWLSRPVHAAGYIPNANGPELVRQCAKRLASGRSVLIFPEGTRSPKGSLGSFARGAAHIAIRSGVDPTPVTVCCDPATLFRGSVWWKVPDCQPVVTIEVGQSMSIGEALRPGSSRSRVARAVTVLLHDYFEERVQ